MMMRHDIQQTGLPENEKTEFVPKSCGGDLPEFIDNGGCDLLIVIGSSINQQPFCQIVKRTTKGCPQILINPENNRMNYCFDFENTYDYPNRLFL